MPEDWDDTRCEADVLIHAVTVDDYGVPSNLMGVHHEDFFSLLGRIVVLSAVLENHVLVVYQSLVRAAQNEHTSLPVRNLLERCRKELHRLDGCPNDHQLVETFLKEAEAMIERRNHYVHNLWPAQPGGRLFGWRPPRNKGSQDAITVDATLVEMRGDLASLVDLLDVRRWHWLLSVVTNF